MQGVQEPMEEFASWLSNQLDLPVTDLTGLKGKYDFSLYWTVSEPIAAGPPLAAEPGLGTSTGSADSGPNLLTAIQLQSGLKLVSKNGPVSVIVIDHAEKVPIGN
jgi:uncharacterized protein (TIGR03435 family)